LRNRDHWKTLSGLLQNASLASLARGTMPRCLRRRTEPWKSGNKSATAQRPNSLLKNLVALEKPRLLAVQARLSQTTLQPLSANFCGDAFFDRLLEKPDWRTWRAIRHFHAGNEENPKAESGEAKASESNAAFAVPLEKAGCFALCCQSSFLSIRGQDPRAASLSYRERAADARSSPRRLDPARRRDMPWRS